MGCKRNVLTWITRGVPYRPQRTPPQHTFRNQRSYTDDIEFVHTEIMTHLQDGSFKIIDREDAIIINPLQVVKNDRGKRRMCVDSRFANAFLATPKFKLETLTNHLPTILQRGDKLITSDVSKAYYSIPLDEAAGPLLF